MSVFNLDGWSPEVQNEARKLEFNFNIRIGWDGNQWIIEGYEWTFATLDELKSFCRKYL